MWPSRHISRFIARSPAEVSAYLADPANLPRWAAGLASGARVEDGALIVSSPIGEAGEVRVRFAAGGELGIFDHDVTLPDGSTFHNPLRVLSNDGGSEVVFTLYRRGTVSDEDFERDERQIGADLERLRDILQGE